MCDNCVKRLIKCMECHIFLLYPLECDPAYIVAVYAAEKVKATQNRKPRDRSVVQPNSPQPIRIKPEDRMRLPAPKNLVLSSLMEATIGTFATTNSLDIGDGEHNNEPSGENEDKRIMAGVNIVTGGCGTYAVSSKTGVTVYACKTSPSSSLSDTNSFVNNNDGAKQQKENNYSHTPQKQQLQSPSSWNSDKSISHPPSQTTTTL